MAIFPVNFHSRHVTTVVTRPHTVDFVDCTCDKIDRADFVASRLVTKSRSRLCR